MFIDMTSMTPSMRYTLFTFPPTPATHSSVDLSTTAQPRSQVVHYSRTSFPLIIHGEGCDDAVVPLYALNFANDPLGSIPGIGGCEIRGLSELLGFELSRGLASARAPRPGQGSAKRQPPSRGSRSAGSAVMGSRLSLYGAGNASRLGLAL